MFLTPAAEPVWGGTYFPPVSKFGRPAFTDILREVSRMFKEEPDKIEQNRAALLARLADKARPAGKVTVGLKELDGAAKQVGNMFDHVNGGLRGAPKFPQPFILEMLWRAGMRSGDEKFFETVEHSLDRMCEGGIYDHLGGGFSRYSVDERWLVPHFEKMLYDNALLLELLALAWQRSGNHLFKTRARETVAWLAREMTTPDGAFAASLDADSEGEEGKFYVWSENEIVELIGPEAAGFFARFYDVSHEGNFEGHTILNRLKAPPRTPADEERLTALRTILLDARAGRIRPGLDDKVLADWNGLMIAALVNAAVIFDEPSWIAMARRAFDFIATTMTRDANGENRLGHSYRAGTLVFPGLASDFAAMIRAAIALHEATGERAVLDQALIWQRALDAHYTDPETGGYYWSADDAGDLLMRPHSTADEATPNPNSVAAQNLVRLAVLSGDDKWRDRADRLMDSIISASAQNLLGHVALLNALDLRLRGAEIVVTGLESEALVQTALKLPFIGRVVLRAPTANALPVTHPARDKIAAAPNAAFVCVGERCSLPVTSPDAIAAAVAAMTA
jgi:uncharacterized protein YyaL (SSP411 family)